MPPRLSEFYECSGSQILAMVHQVKYQTHPTNPRKDKVKLGHSVGDDDIPRKIPGQYATAPCGLHPQLWHLEGWHDPLHIPTWCVSCVRGRGDKKKYPSNRRRESVTLVVGSCCLCFHFPLQ